MRARLDRDIAEGDAQQPEGRFGPLSAAQVDDVVVADDTRSMVTAVFDGLAQIMRTGAGGGAQVLGADSFAPPRQDGGPVEQPGDDQPEAGGTQQQEGGQVDVGSFSGDLAQDDFTRAAELALEAGFSPEDAVTAVAVAAGESSLRPDARGDVGLQTDKWGPSLGLWQVRSLNEQSGTGDARDPERLTDPQFNAQSAFEISGGGSNWQPWTVFREGIHQQYLDDARRAVEAVQTRSGESEADARARFRRAERGL